MKALVIYDTFFGNTQQIAESIGAALGEALGAGAEVHTLRVTDVHPEHLAGVGLLIVGSPTRAFKPSPATTAWLKALPADSLKGVQVAAFDTRIPVESAPGFLRVMVKLFGYADKPMADKLQKMGGVLAAPTERFFVTDSEGPLKDGELARAAEWAKQIAAG